MNSPGQYKHQWFIEGPIRKMKNKFQKQKQPEQITYIKGRNKSTNAKEE